LNIGNSCGIVGENKPMITIYYRRVRGVRAVSEIDIGKSEKEIYQHISRDYNKRGELALCEGITMNRDLKNILFYQAFFTDCKWHNCDLTQASANGATFRYNDHVNSKIDYASLQYCNFFQDVFHDCSMQGSNFTQSTFFNTGLDDCLILGTSFMNAVFHRCIIKNCKIKSSNFELCRFQDVKMEDLDLSNLNFRFSYLKNVHMNNVILPFIQIPYTFNGLQYVFQTRDNIYFESHANKEKRIGLESYKKLIDHLISFFSKQQSFFPLANCYDVKGDQESAKQANKNGVIESVICKDFSSLYYYCIQASTVLELSYDERKALYQTINDNIPKNLSPIDNFQFGQYFPLVKQLLFDNPHNRPVMTLSIQTNITINNSPELGILLGVIESAANSSTIQLDGQHIEVRRNSPALIGLTCSGDVMALLQTLENIWKILSPILQDIANFATIAGMLAALYKYINTVNKSHRDHTRKRKKAINDETMAKIDSIRSEINSEYNNKFIEKSTIDNQPNQSSLSVPMVEELKKKGIRILSGDVQLLNTVCDNKLDDLYEQYLQEYYSI
jgi:uncharacterized protein YjbI with pentapeptide repeats